MSLRYSFAGTSRLTLKRKSSGSFCSGWNFCDELLNWGEEIFKFKNILDGFMLSGFKMFVMYLNGVW